MRQKIFFWKSHTQNVVENLVNLPQQIGAVTNTGCVS